MSVAKCSKCDTRHTRPVGRKCTRTVVVAGVPPASSTEGESPNMGNTIVGAASLLPPLQAPPPPPDFSTMFADFQQQLLTQVTTLVQSEVSKALPATAPAFDATTTSNATPSHVPVSNTTVHTPTPTVSSLRQDPTIQAAVTSRIKELEAATIQQLDTHGNNNSILTNNKIKSGRDRLRGQDIRRAYVAWPHEFISVGPSCLSVKYDDLDQAQFSAGLMSMVTNEKDLVTQQVKLKYVTKLHHDMCEVGFKTVHSANALILSQIEEQTLSWENYEELDRVRANFIFSQISAAALKNKSNSSERFPHRNNSNEKICSAFNLGKCNQSRHHSDDNGQYVKHYCSYCFSLGQRWPHTEAACRKRNGPPPTSN